MTHERIHELLCLRLYGECSPEEVQLLETHLAACADCRAFAHELEGTLAPHVDAVPATAPDLPPTWRRDLAASIRRNSSRARRARILTFAAGLAAGMLLLLATRGPSATPRLHETRKADLAPPFVPRADPPAPTTSRGTLALAADWLRRRPHGLPLQSLPPEIRMHRQVPVHPFPPEIPMSRPWILLGLLCTLVPILAHSAPVPPESLLDHLAGRWVLRGEIAHQKTVHDVEAVWVLNQGYLQLHETSREKDAEGRPQYEAILYLTRDPASGEVSVLWLDNTGSGHFSMDGVGRALPEPDSLPFVFRSAQGEIDFTNTFAWDAKANSWTWSMDNVVQGVHEPFGRVTLTRE